MREQHNTFGYKRAVKMTQRNKLRDPSPKIGFQWEFVFRILKLVIAIIILAPIELIRWLFQTKKPLQGKVCMVTGAARGLGRHLCLRLVKEKAQVICVDINEDGNEETAKMIRERGGVARAYTVNIGVRQEVNSLAKAEPHVDILVLNASLIGIIKMDELTEKDVIGCFNINCISHFWFLEEYLKPMMARNDGHIVLISSLAAYMGSPFLTLYSATKGATTALSDGLRCELQVRGLTGVKVTTAHPYFINTAADYVDPVKEIKTPVLEASEAAKEIIAAVQYEKSNIIVPKSMTLSGMLRLLPNYIVRELTSIFVTGKVKIDSKEHLMTVSPYGDILERSV